LSYSPLDPQLRSWADDMADLFGPTAPQIAKRQAQLKAAPGDLHNVQRLALVFDRANEDPQAISVLKDAFAAHPDDIATAQMLVTLYLKQNNLVSAQSVYGQLSESSDPQNAFMGRILLGDLYMRQGMNDQAAQVYLQAENSLPSQKAVVDSRMGDMYFGAGDYASALKYYDPLHTSDPQNRTVTLRYAETLIRDNQVDAGLEILDSNVLNRNPNDEEALVIKGLAFLTQHPQKLPDALNDLNEALTLSPQDPHALYDRAQVYVALNPPEFQKAIDDLSLLESVEPNDKNAVPTKEMLAQVFAMNKQYPEAVHEYEQAVALDPADQNVRFGFAQLLFDLAQQYQQLSADDVSDNAATLRLIDPITVLGNLIRDSLDLGPQNIQYAQWLVYQGQYDMLTGNTNEGIQATEKAYNAANKSPAAALAYLRVLLAGQQYAKIVDIATQAIALSPRTSDFYVIRGKAFSELNRFPESNADFEQALTLNLGNAEQFFSVLTFYQQASKDPSWTSMVINNLKALLGQHHDQSAMIYTALSIVEFLNNDVPSALSSASTALTFNPTGVIQINALRVAALAAYQLNKNDQAETYYKQLIQVMPGDSSAYNNMAYLLAVRLNNPQMALQYATQANDLLAKQQGVIGFAHNANILDTLGWIYYMTGDMADAQDALQASMQYDPPPTAYYHLGQVLAALKKDSDAREVLQNGLNAAEKTNDPVSSQIEALLKQLK